MASRADVEVLAGANADIQTLIGRELAAFWATLDLSKPELARDLLAAFAVAEVEKYGDIAAAVAADWYLNVREASGVKSKFTSILAPTPPTEVLQKRVRFGAAGLFTETPNTTRSFMASMLNGYSLGTGRQTLIQSAARDPWAPRLARVPSGRHTCAFCLVLASRGPVYHSEASAGRFRKFHDDCDCQIVPIGHNDSLPDGYDPVALHHDYLQARAGAVGEDTSSILAEFRTQQGVS